MRILDLRRYVAEHFDQGRNARRLEGILADAVERGPVERDGDWP